MHIVKLHEVYEGKLETIIVTEILTGGELFEKVSTPEFVLTEAECSQFVKQICEGVSYIHEQVVEFIIGQTSC